MGVSTLWAYLAEACTKRSLAEFVLEPFSAKTVPRNPYRCLRVGVDASIWLKHVQVVPGGVHPALRGLFDKVNKLVGMPVLAVFVFDGPGRPGFKRGKTIAGSKTWPYTRQFQELLDNFGFPHTTAPGEAEAELAYMNRVGIIDIILTDDVDSFIFGASAVMRNWSLGLSGNKTPLNHSEVEGNDQIAIYRSSDILDIPSINLTRNGLILIALMVGGDYHQAGWAKCGIQIAAALAQCGYGEELVKIYLNSSPDRVTDLLNDWKAAIRKELISNSRNYMSSKHPSLATSIPEDFPNLQILESYLRPLTSESQGNVPVIDWEQQPDLAGISRFCEKNFEWGVSRERMLYTLRGRLWGNLVSRSVFANSLPRPCHVNEHSLKLLPPLDRIVTKLHSESRVKTHSYTHQYQLYIQPEYFVEATIKGLKGDAAEFYKAALIDDSLNHYANARVVSKSEEPFKIPVFAELVQSALPYLSDEFEKAKELKKLPKQKKSQTKPTLKRSNSELPLRRSKASDSAMTKEHELISSEENLSAGEDALSDFFDEDGNCQDLDVILKRDASRRNSTAKCERRKVSIVSGEKESQSKSLLPAKPARVFARTASAPVYSSRTLSTCPSGATESTNLSLQSSSDALIEISDSDNEDRATKFENKSPSMALFSSKKPRKALKINPQSVQRNSHALVIEISD